VGRPAKKEEPELEARIGGEMEAEIGGEMET
jgi:hypothetical protein